MDQKTATMAVTHIYSIITESNPNIFLDAQYLLSLIKEICRVNGEDIIIDESYYIQDKKHIETLDIQKAQAHQEKIKMGTQFKDSAAQDSKLPEISDILQLDVSVLENKFGLMTEEDNLKLEQRGILKLVRKLVRSIKNYKSKSGYPSNALMYDYLNLRREVIRYDDSADKESEGELKFADAYIELQNANQKVKLSDRNLKQTIEPISMFVWMQRAYEADYEACSISKEHAYIIKSLGNLDNHMDNERWSKFCSDLDSNISDAPEAKIERSISTNPSTERSKL